MFAGLVAVAVLVWAVLEWRAEGRLYTAARAVHRRLKSRSSSAALPAALASGGSASANGSHLSELSHRVSSASSLAGESDHDEGSTPPASSPCSCPPAQVFFWLSRFLCWHLPRAGSRVQRGGEQRPSAASAASFGAGRWRSSPSMGSHPGSFDGGAGGPAEIELDDAAHGLGTVAEASDVADHDADNDGVESREEAGAPLKDERGRTWTVHASDDGTPYYFCAELGATQWERPC